MSVLSKKRTPAAQSVAERGRQLALKAQPVVQPVVENAGPMARSAAEAARQGAASAAEWAGPQVDKARAWAAPRLESAGQAVQDTIAPRIGQTVQDTIGPKVSEALVTAAHRIDTAPAARRRRWPKVLVGVALLGAAGAAAAAVMMRRKPDLAEPEPFGLPETDVPAAGQNGTRPEDGQGTGPDSDVLSDLQG